MKILLVDSNKVKSFLLPEKIEDSYSINYTSQNGTEETITLEAVENYWTIESSKSITYYEEHEEITSRRVINIDSCYRVKFEDSLEPILMYCLDTPEKYTDYSLESHIRITVGQNDSNDIMYDDPGICNREQITFFKDGQNWILDSIPSATKTYLNGHPVMKKYIKTGDIIFIRGLKIIWLAGFIRMTNPNGKIKTTLTPMKELSGEERQNKYDEVKEGEKLKSLYNDNQLFFHTPRIRNNYEKVKIKIEPPPQQENDNGPPAILTLGATVLMGMSSSINGLVSIYNVVSGRKTLMSSLTEIIMCVAMIIGTIMLPIILDKYQRAIKHKNEKKRITKYSEYLNKKKMEIESAINAEKESIVSNYLNNNELQQNIFKKTNKVWLREIIDSDFLSFSLGTGNAVANIEVSTNLSEFTLDDDNMLKEVKSISETRYMLENVPIISSLIDNKILPLIINHDFPNKKELINNIMLQIIGYHSGNDLKIVIMTNEENEEYWQYLKYLPHCTDENRTICFYSDGEEDSRILSAFLEKEYTKRVEQIENNSGNANEPKVNENYEPEELYKQFETYYLIITDDYIAVKDFEIIKKIINSSSNLGFSLLTIESTIKNLPSKCNEFISISKEKSGILGKDLSKFDPCQFEPELMKQDIGYYMRIIANIPLKMGKEKSELPKSLNFLEMYKVGKIEQLNILNKWKINDPTESLHTPLGIGEDGKVFEIDLHEKMHGPHGLIAGATGSGKSEFIITFILSMAINYHPYEVQFVLIDYKGGGLAGAFENRETGVKIPHLIGTITNLDTSEMNRTLVSINSELKRRQRMFNEVRDRLGESTIDIYKYQKFYREGKIDEPISHLFIISDEFAELKQQQPEFMDELVSTARIGRSLGVHLILATQKPSGVVNDQIWSNSKFRIALKVQNEADSNEILKRPDAANIKETGRFYLQVGNNELFALAQSAWSGAKYTPAEKLVKSVDDSIEFIGDTGNITKKINDEAKIETTNDLGDQLTNIVNTLYELAKKENIEFKQLWLPSIPKDLYLGSVVEKYKYKPTPYKIEAIIGEYDNPAMQFQDKLIIDVTNTGNLIIYGNAGSGKENLIATYVYSICAYHTPEEVCFYIMDYGAETLKKFTNMPHVGDIGLIEDKEKLIECFNKLNREITRRKELFSNYGGSYNSYIKTNQPKLPLYIVVINGYESFLESHGRYDDYLAHLLRESSKYGIVFVISSIAAASVKARISQSFQNKIMLQVSDEYDYKYYMNAPSELKPAKYFGRGLATVGEDVFEFQTAMIYIRDKIDETVRLVSTKYEERFKKNPPIPIIPSKINAETIAQYVDHINNLPIGFSINEASVVNYDFSKDKINQIIGNNVFIEKSFILELAKTFSIISNVKVTIFDFVNCIQTPPTDITCINDEFTANIKQIKASEVENKNIKVYLIVGISHINERVLKEGINFLYQILNNANSFANSYFVLIDNLISYKKLMNEQWYATLNDKSGIWLGKDIENQSIFKIDNLTKTDANESYEGLAFVIKDSMYTVIKGLGVNEGGD